jgi:hypothetical protein
MKRLFLITTTALLAATISFGQKWHPETICSMDTLIVEPYISIKYSPDKLDSLTRQPYKIVQCRTRSNIGFRFDIAVSNYYYGKNTTNWLGQHGGPNFSFILVVDKLNFGFRFKPWTIDPKKEMIFDGKILPITASLNAIKLDYYVGYSIDFDKLISVEPHLGYNRSSFIVINEDDLNQTFTFDKTGGPIIGATFNKYFKLKDYEYLSLFGTVGYTFVNFEKVHPDLDNGYFEWNLGIAYKGFITRHFNKRVE